MGVAREYNGSYRGEQLERVASPMGGIGAGMMCLEGVGGLNHVSLRNEMDFFHEPKKTFAAITIKGEENVARVLEGPNPQWKYFGSRGSANGGTGFDYGLPRFAEAEFNARFPFAVVNLHDPEVPHEVGLTGWSPFIPGNTDDSSLPVAALEYEFANPGAAKVEAMFSYHTENFMALDDEQSIAAVRNGVLLRQEPSKEHPE